MEDLGRGLVAICRGQGQVYVGWRLLGTDPDEIAFDLYRSTDGQAPVKLNARPITDSTTSSMTRPTRAARLVLRSARARRSAAGGKRPVRAAGGRAGATVPVHALQTPAGYTPNDASVGDLDGDGEYEIVLHQASRGARQLARRHDGRADPRGLQARRHAAVADQPGQEHPRGRALHAVHGLRPRRRRQGGGRLQDGRRHRRRDRARSSATRPPITATRRATSSTGRVPHRLRRPHRRGAGHDRLPPAPRQRSADWGDDYGNRVDRFLACVAYLDGKRPSLVMCRGYYTRAVLAAWNWRDGKLTRRVDLRQRRRHAGQPRLSRAGQSQPQRRRRRWRRQATRSSTARAPSTTTARGSTRPASGTATRMHLSDIDPDRPGLEVFAITNAPAIPRRGASATRARAA